MRWRRRLCRTAKWICAAPASRLAVAWQASVPGWLQWAPSSGRYLICNSRGSLIIDWIPGYHGKPEVYWIPHVTGTGLRAGPYIDTNPLQSEWRWRPRLIRKDGLSRALLIIPIWVPIALAAAAWLTLRWRDRCYSYRGWCYRCDYDCRDIPTTAPCPECGRERILKKTRPRPTTSPSP